MGILSNQLLNVVEWDEREEGVIFWKWPNDEIKKGSKLFIRPGQDAIFMYQGKIEGAFSDDGQYDIEGQIIPFLSSLKGFKFGFNSGMRAEVVFINTKELLCKWGTKNAINLQAPGLPGGRHVLPCCRSDDGPLAERKARRDCLHRSGSVLQLSVCTETRGCPDDRQNQSVFPRHR